MVGCTHTYTNTHTHTQTHTYTPAYGVMRQAIIEQRRKSTQDIYACISAISLVCACVCVCVCIEPRTLRYGWATISTHEWERIALWQFVSTQQTHKFSALQCVVVYCCALQCVAVCCSMLHCVATQQKHKRYLCACFSAIALMCVACVCVCARCVCAYDESQTLRYGWVTNSTYEWEHVIYQYLRLCVFNGRGFQKTTNSVSRHHEHTATHCNTLQHIATHYNTLQHTATHCNTLQHTATDDRMIIKKTRTLYLDITNSMIWKPQTLSSNQHEIYYLKSRTPSFQNYKLTCNNLQGDDSA